MKTSTVYDQFNKNQRRYIINDFKLPKIVTDSPYFNSQAELLHDYGFGDTFSFVSNKVNEFQGNTELFFDEVNKLSYSLFNYILELYSNDDIQKILSTTNKEPYNDLNVTYRNSLINDDAVGSDYIRLDINQACFNVLKVLTCKMDDFATYDYLVHSFHWFDEPVREYVAKSKRIRSYIFGSIQKQLIIHLEKHIMSELIQLMNINHAVFKDCDEIVMHDTVENYIKVENALESYRYKNIIRIERFSLKSIDHGYVEDYNGSIVFKGVPSDMFAEQYAKYYHYTPLDDYKVFNHQRIPCMRLL